jgi:hypothetical protein
MQQDDLSQIPLVHQHMYRDKNGKARVAMPHAAEKIIAGLEQSLDIASGRARIIGYTVTATVHRPRVVAVRVETNAGVMMNEFDSIEAALPWLREHGVDTERT